MNEATRKMAKSIVANWEHARTHRRWQAAWRRTDDPRVTKPRDIPAELRDAVDHGWFRPGSSVLEIGCGNGDIAAWLARGGFEVVACDFAEAAIHFAQSRHADVRGGRLAFRTLDICRAVPGPGPFDAILDYGCFQNVHAALRANYVRHVIASSSAAARFLLLIPLLKTTRREAMAGIESAFRPAFEISRAHDTVLALANLPGLAIWMTRCQDVTSPTHPNVAAAGSRT